MQVVRSRGESLHTTAHQQVALRPALERAALPAVAPERRTEVRGRCSICHKDVTDSQPRLKDPITGLYQHDPCPAGDNAGAAAAPPHDNRANVAEAAGDSVAAIKAAADSARAELDAIVAEKRRAESALAKAQADSEKVLAAMAAQQAAYVRANAASAVRSATPSTQGLKEVLPTASKIKPLLPNGTHAFLSYQWDVQGQVIHIKELLNQRNVKCWMDIDGGMKSDIYDSMAEGVQGAACIICFMTQAYQDSANCKLELKFAQQSGVPIIPVMIQRERLARHLDVWLYLDTDARSCVCAGWN